MMASATASLSVAVFVWEYVAGWQVVIPVLLMPRIFSRKSL